MESALVNYDLIWNLCCSHDTQLSHPSCEEPVGDKECVGEEEGGTKEPMSSAEEDEEEGDEKRDQPAAIPDAKEIKEKDVEEPYLDTGTESRKAEKDGEDKGTLGRRGKNRAQMWLAARKLTKNKDMESG